MFIEKLTPDTSVIIEGTVSKKLENKEFEIKEIIIHEAVLSELEHQANLGKAIGYIGLDELQRLRKLMQGKLRYAGRKPTASEIRRASLGEIDSLIRGLAYEEDSTLITADKVQYEVAQAKGIKVIFIKPKEAVAKLKIENFFDENTMSIHLRENLKPHAKKGQPGKWKFQPVSEKKLSQDEIKELSREIIENTKLRKDSFIEISREGSTIVQLGHYRIVITRPPFSDGWEITAVKPIKKLNIEDYKLSEKLKKRISEQAQGVLIAGAPGEGKTTFCSALAEFYANKGFVVKTVEAPRDLILGDNVTQYAISHSNPEEIHDILLLSRPDYTLFDEMRNTPDFKLFADLRLAGIQFLGVVHATNPMDAIQRFVGRIELGMIPQVIDTVIFIKNGKVDKVLSLKMLVKVPTGMVEADLARPVVEVNDFETNNLEFEMYTYGEETVVVPVQTQQTTTPAKKLAAKQIEKEMQKYVSNVEAEIISDNKVIIYIPEREVPKIIGKGGKRIESIEKKIGINIDVRPAKSKRREQKTLSYEIRERGNNLIIKTETKGQTIDIYIEEEFLFTSNTSKQGEIKINKKSELGRTIIKALELGKKIIVKES